MSNAISKSGREDYREYVNGVLKEYSSLQDNPYNVRCIHTVLIVHNYFAPRGVVNVLISETIYCTAVHYLPLEAAIMVHIYQ